MVGTSSLDINTSGSSPSVSLFIFIFYFGQTLTGKVLGSRRLTLRYPFLTLGSRRLARGQQRRRQMEKGGEGRSWE